MTQIAVGEAERRSTIGDTMRPASVPTVEPLLHRKQDFVRGAIWDAAVDLFVEKGYDQTTVDDIARAAGVSKRSFFRYFSSKSDLMGQGMVTYASHITEAIQGAPRSRSVMDIVRHTVRQVTVTASAYPRVRKIAHVASTSVAAREAQLSRLAELEDRVAEAYRVRVQAARRDTLTPRLLAELTLSVLDVTFREWFAQDAADIIETTEKVFAVLTDVVREQKPSRAAARVLRPVTRTRRER
jgi:AcrR family transcriptional regulator